MVEALCLCLPAGDMLTEAFRKKRFFPNITAEGMRIWAGGTSLEGVVHAAVAKAVAKFENTSNFFLVYAYQRREGEVTDAPEQRASFGYDPDWHGVVEGTRPMKIAA